jgi:hypothetical protein
MEIWEGGNSWLFYRKNRKEVAVGIGIPEKGRPSILCLGQRGMANGILLSGMQRSMDYFHP